MGLFKKKSAQDIIVEAKLSYARGNIKEASRLLHSLKYNELRNYGEALYLLSKIYLESISQLTDQGDIDNKYKVVESFLFRAKELSHKEAKVLYDQYFDSQGLLKTNQKETMKETLVQTNIPDNRQDNKEKEVKIENTNQTQLKDQKTAEVSKQDNKVNQDFKYAHENGNVELSYEMINVIREYVYEYIHQYYSGSQAYYIPEKEKREIKKLFPSLNLDHVIFYYHETVKFKTKWYLFTPFDYYDSFKTHVSIKNVVKTDSYVKNNYYGNVTRLYYKNGSTAEFKFAVNDYRLSDFILRINDCGKALRDKGYNYQSKKDYVKAYEYYLSSAILYGNAAAENDLGTFYQNGHYVNKDYDRAIYWYELSVNQNNVYAQANLGNLYRFLKQYDKAFHYLKTATDNNTTNTGAYNNLGICYLEGQGVKFNLDNAIKYFMLASDKGNMYGDYNLGRVYTLYKADYKTGFEYYSKAALKKHSSAHIALGLAYFYGRGVEVDYNKALEYYNTAIQINDNSYGYANIGSYYAKIENDMNKAMDYYNKAIEHGWTGYNIIASLYLNPKYKKVNYLEALKWLNKGIEANNESSKFKLALMYIDGLGVEKDYNKAFEILSNADYEQNMSVRSALGKLYLEGKGVNKNSSYGQQLLDEAIERKDTYARYYMGCSLIEGEYQNKDINLGVNYLLDLLKIKGDEYSDNAQYKLLDYIGNPQYNLIHECNTDNLMYLFKTLDFTEHPSNQVEIAKHLYKKLPQCNAYIYGILGKSYHFGIHNEIDYDKAIDCYEKCLYSIDYRYNSEIEFNYASLRFEGKGDIQDFVYGFNMAKAIGAYEGKCPDNAKPYLEGKDKFIDLVIQYLDDCKQFEFIHYAASLVDLNKSEYAILKESVEAKEGHNIYRKAMDMIANFNEKDKRDKEMLAQILEERKNGYQGLYDRKKNIFEFENEMIERDILETLLKSADHGCFDAIRCFDDRYDDDVYLDYFTLYNYRSRLMQYHDDQGILKQGNLLYWVYQGTAGLGFGQSLMKVRELIVARERNTFMFKEALDIAYNELNNFYNPSLINDDVYMKVLKESYNDYDFTKYKFIKYVLGIEEHPHAEVIMTPPSKHVYIDFDISNVDKFNNDFISYAMVYFEDFNKKHNVNFYIKDKKIIDAFNCKRYDFQDDMFTFKEGDNVKLEFIGINDIENHVLYFIKNFVDISNFNKVKDLEITGNYSMSKVIFTHKDNNKYYFMNESTSETITVEKEKTVYMASYFKKNYESYMICKGNTPLFVFNIETKQRLL